MTTKSPTQLSREWFDRVWNNGEADVIYEMTSPDCIIRGLNLEAPGPEGYAAQHEVFMRTFESVEIEMVKLLEAGDEVMGHALFHATHKASGRCVKVPFSFTAIWRDGRIVEADNIIDYFAMATQLGLISPETISKAFVY